MCGNECRAKPTQKKDWNRHQAHRNRSTAFSHRWRRMVPGARSRAFGRFRNETQRTEGKQRQPDRFYPFRLARKWAYFFMASNVRVVLASAVASFLFLLSVSLCAYTSTGRSKAFRSEINFKTGMRLLPPLPNAGCCQYGCLCRCSVRRYVGAIVNGASLRDRQWLASNQHRFIFLASRTRA